LPIQKDLLQIIYQEVKLNTLIHMIHKG